MWPCVHQVYSVVQLGIVTSIGLLYFQGHPQRGQVFCAIYERLYIPLCSIFDIEQNWGRRGKHVYQFIFSKKSKY